MIAKRRGILLSVLILASLLSGPLAADTARTAFIGVDVNNYQLLDLRFAGWFRMFYVDLLMPGWGTFLTQGVYNAVMGKPEDYHIRPYEYGEMERNLSWRAGFLYPVEDFLGIGGGLAFEQMHLHDQNLTDADSILGLGPEIALHFGLGSKVNILAYATFLNAADKGEDLNLRVETNLSANVSILPHLSVFASVNYGMLKDYQARESSATIPSFNNTSFYLGVAGDLLN